MTIDMYCRHCDEIMEWVLDTENDNVKVYECTGYNCLETYFEPK